MRTCIKCGCSERFAGRGLSEGTCSSSMQGRSERCGCECLYATEWVVRVRGNNRFLSSWGFTRRRAEAVRTDHATATRIAASMPIAAVVEESQ